MEFEYILYLFFACILSAYFARKTDKKIYCFVIIFWIFSQPIIKAKFNYPLFGLPFTFSPDRILFMFLTCYWLVELFLKNKGVLSSQKKSEKNISVKYLLIYLTIVIAITCLNYSYIGIKKIFATPLEIIVFLIIFYAGKQITSPKVYDSIIKSILVLAIFSAALAVIQCAVDPYFLRTNENIRLAFGSIYRASGIFRDEYILGIFQILSIIVLLSSKLHSFIKNGLIIFLMFSVFLTFHRLDFLIMTVCLIGHIVFFSKWQKSIVVGIMFAVAIMAMVLSVFLFKSTGGQSDFLEKRVESKTYQGRLVQYRVVLDEMVRSPLGLGTYNHPKYFNLMKRYKIMQTIHEPNGKWHVKPLTVHNGFLAVGIKYGILGVLFFSLFIFSMLSFLVKKISRSQPATAIPFFSILIWILSNISNDLSEFRIYYISISAIICGGFLSVNALAENND